MRSPEGRCKTLDASADGYVRAEACSVLALHLLEGPGVVQGPGEVQAPFLLGEEQRGGGGPAVLAWLLGSSVNQDGRSSSLTAPNGPSQREVMTAAMMSAGVEASSVVMVQMHGTGKGLPLLTDCQSFYPTSRNSVCTCMLTMQRTAL